MTNSLLPPIPDQVRAKLFDLLPGIRKKKWKGMVCPAGGFTASLFLEGLLSEEEIVGLLDNDESKHDTLVVGHQIKPIAWIEKNPPDFIIISSMSFNKEILAQLLPLSRRYRFKILDICSAPDRTLQLPFVNSLLAPIPAAILENLCYQIPSLISHHSKVFLYPNHPLMLNLWMRGVFANLDVRGVIDEDTQLAGADYHGLKICPSTQLDQLEADAVLVAKPRCHRRQIAAEFGALAPASSLKIIDLFEGMTAESLRSEYAESLGRQIWANRIAEWPTRKVQIGIHSQNPCDSLCAISAAREFARRQPNLEVQFQYMPEILNAYGDDLVRYSSGGYLIPNHSEHFLSERWSSIAGNYQACHYLGLGMNFNALPRPELPMLSPIKGLEPRSYIALLGAEGLKPLLSTEQLNSIIQASPLPVICIENAKTSPQIKGVEFIADSPLEMLRLIQHAAVVLTSRTTPAHIAAAYDAPSIILAPPDCYDWHIDYPAWNHRRIRPSTHGFIDQIKETMEFLMCASQFPITLKTTAAADDLAILGRDQASASLSEY